MSKKYLLYIVLLAAVVLLGYVRSNQHNHYPGKKQEDNITIPVNTEEGFNRHPEKIIYSKHAKCRMDCRHIDETEVKEVLDNGTVNYNKIEEDNRGKTFPLEGITHDKQHVRIVVASKRNDLVIVTVIDLDKDWYCDCK